MNRTAIVTGANGFIGRAVVSELLDNDYFVYAVVRPGSSPSFGHPKCIVVESDLFGLDSLKDLIPINCVRYFFHFAWAGSAGKSRANYSLQLSNVKSTLDACVVAKDLGCSRFIVAGSIMETETYAATTLDGNTPGLGYIYGAAKLATRAMCMPLASSLGIELLWGVITNAYGVGEISQRMVNTTIVKCIKGESPQFTAGTQNYDFVYITDVARAFRLMAEKGRANSEYLIGSGNARPLKHFLLEMQKAIAPNLKFYFGNVPFTGVNLPLKAFDLTKTSKELGFVPEVDFAEGCKRTMEWLKLQKRGL